jgi:uncharacterized protein (TIGR04255 family)
MAEGVITPDLNETFPRLSRPPIVEAVIHWQARAQKWAEPKAQDAALAERLPQYGTREPIQQVALMATVSGAAYSPVVHHRSGWQGTRLKSPDGRYVIQFTRDGLVFSQTKEYQDWESFQNAAKECWMAYMELAAPMETQRLGVRFINHIATATASTLRDFLRDPPTCPSNLPLEEFVYQSTFSVPGHPFGIRVIKLMQPSMPELPLSSGLFLDIDVFSTTAIPNGPSPLDEALTRMRRLKNQVFFGLLTEAAVRLFK